jgi:AraC-like DNA-binding protein
VTQVAYQTGFSSLSFFAKAFQEEFGKTPSAYLADQKVDDQEH